MGKYALIALDVDGTLLNSELRLSAGNREAVRRAARAGKVAAISTGRCLAELREVLALLPEIRYLICESGSCVYDLKYDHTLFVRPIPTDLARRMLEYLRSEKCVIQVFHENQSYINRPNDEWMDACRVGNYRQVFNRTCVWDVHLFDDFARRPFRIEKFNLYFENAATRERIAEKLAAEPVKLAFSFGYMLEVISSAADKGVGLRALCERLGLPVEAAIAVGDSENDVEILREAGLSVAMGNACRAAKDAADLVTADCDHDGVARVIEEYLLDGESVAFT